MIPTIESALKRELVAGNSKILSVRRNAIKFCIGKILINTG
jgi:hypothetical protein